MGAVCNTVRGEVAARFSGRDYRLCLTLGALAELEGAFGADDLGALAARFQSGKLSARDLVKIVGAGLRGAGVEIDDAAVARLTHEEGLAGFVRVSAALVRAAFEGPETAANPPAPQAD